MKLCSSDNHYTTAPLSSIKGLYKDLHLFYVMLLQIMELRRLFWKLFLENFNWLVMFVIRNRFKKQVFATALFFILLTLVVGLFVSHDMQHEENRKDSVNVNILQLKWQQRDLIPRLYGWVFVYELRDCEFEFRCCHLNFRYRACFEQVVPWHSGNYSRFTLIRVLDM